MKTLLKVIWFVVTGLFAGLAFGLLFAMSALVRHA